MTYVQQTSLITQLFLFVEIFPGVKQDVDSLSVLGQPLNNKCPDISEYDGKKIAAEICKFAKSNLVQVNIRLANFAGVAINLIGVLDMASSPILLSQYLGFPELKKYMAHSGMKSYAP